MAKNASSKRAKLRLQAEQRLRDTQAEAVSPGTEPDTLRLFHELQVHQIELELQNEELGAARTAAETALERYTDLYDFAPVGYFTLTREGHVVEANLTGAALVGMTRPRLLRCMLGRFVAREELGRWDQHLISVLGSSERQACELPLRREDGSTFYARLDSVRLDPPSPQDQFDGPLPAMRVVMSDITERQQIERRQHLLAEILRNLNKAVPFGEAISLILAAIRRETGVDAVGIRLRSDDAFPYFAQSGFSPGFIAAEKSLAAPAPDRGVCMEQDGALNLACTCGLVLSGKTDPTDPQFTPGGSFWTNDPVPLLRLPPDQDPRLHPRNRCIHEGFRSVALIPIRASREIVGLLHLSDRRKDRFTPAAIGFFEELSASIGVALVRKRMEEALRASEARYRSFMEVTGQLGWTTDADGEVTEDLPAWRKFTGLTAEQLRGRGWLRALHPDDADRAAAVWRQAVASGRDYECAYRLRREDGVYRHFLARGMPVVRDDGTVREWAGTCIDITEREQSEETRRKVAEELVRSNRDLEQFATVASHDLQEPLRAVAGYSQLLQKRYHGRLDEQAARFLQGAIDGADRMQRLIDDLLAFSRVGSQGTAPRLVAADAAVAEALANLKTAIEESGAIVACGPLPEVRADDRQLAQLLQNLIGNALKFRSDRALRIDIAAVRQESHWLFSVRDNGIGIEAQHLGHIFEIFKRLHSRAKFPGTGVGLAICKRIVERHGGTIWAESEPGRGSTFFFTLPDGS